MKTYLITGCAGFIGSNFVHYMLKKYPEILLVNLDKLTYAGNLENLKDVVSCEKLRGFANETRSADIRMGQPGR